MEAFTRYVLPGAAVLCAAIAVGTGFGGTPAVALFAGIFAAVFACGWVIATSTRWGVLLTALGCLGSNLYLLSHKWQASAEPSICTVNAVINCDLVNSSAYSELLGTPVTLFGAAFYVGLAAAAALAIARPDTSSRFHQVNALFSLAALAFSAYLGAASVAIGAVCAMCISIYLGNGLLLIAGIKGLRESDVAIAEDLGTALTSPPFWTIAGLFLAVTLAGRSAWMGRDGAIAAVEPKPAHPLTPSERVGALYAKPVGEVTLDGSEPILGDPDAPYLVVEFADFGCPHCAHASKAFKQAVAEHPELQVRFKAFPLSGLCNPLIEGDAGGERCLGAVAAECASKQGKFWGMSQNMFRNLGYLGLDDLRFMAGQEGLDVERWEACLQDPTAHQSVIDDVEAGIKAGVQGTPTLFLKGIQGDDFVLVLYTVDEVVAIIEAAEAGVPMPPPGPAPQPG
jgi:protein-disulfide isomerase/uncharacterized membrane protein